MGRFQKIPGWIRVVFVCVLLGGIMWFFTARDAKNYQKDQQSPWHSEELIERIEKGKVTSVEDVVFQSNTKNVFGKYYTADNGDGASFKFSFTTDKEYENLKSSFDSKGFRYKVQNALDLSWVTWLIILIAIAFWAFISYLQRRGGGIGRGAFGVRGTHTEVIPGLQRVTLDDVGGCEEAKDAFEDIIKFLKNREHFIRVKAKMPKGVLVTGSPGTGKTLLAKAVAGEAGSPFYKISGSDFVEMYVGVGAGRVRDFFRDGKMRAAEHGSCILFIDEIDAVGQKREGGPGSNDERHQTLNQILVEMDGFDAIEGVIVIAATNRPDILDTALLQRFPFQIALTLPDRDARAKIFKVHTIDKGMPLAEDVDLKILARETPMQSGRVIADICNEAAIKAGRQEKLKVEMRDFREAKDIVIMGRENKSLKMVEKEKERTARHEAGHTIVNWVLYQQDKENVDPLHKVTIIPRGQALGLTQSFPLEDRYHWSKKRLEYLLQIFIGGRVAEEIFYQGNVSSGAGDDLKRMTELARKMVCEWGMSEKLGPMCYGQQAEFMPPWGPQNFSEAAPEIKFFIDSAYKEARQILEDNKGKLDKLVAALMERETLSGEEIDIVLVGKELDSEKSLVEKTLSVVEGVIKLPVEVIKGTAEGLKKGIGGIVNGGEKPEPGK